jgi:hypothetical protein
LRFRPSEQVLAALGAATEPSGDARSAAGATAAGRGARPGTSPSANPDAVRARLDTSVPETRAPRALLGAGTVAPEGDATGGDPAVIWTLEEGSLMPVGVRTGLTDGTQTAVLEPGALSAGSEVVTAVQVESAEDTRSASPLIPFRRGGGRR